MIRVSINGDPRDVTAATITDLVAELGLVPATILVEHNSLALHRSEWPEAFLSTSDRIEILKVAAGG